jgi:ATP-dependent DNA helicase RecQ
MITNPLKKASQNLKDFWGYDSFREGQKEALQAVFEGRDTLVLLPTGGGKSLCYQIPATVLKGMTLVISPLISLMQDQVQQLNERGISAAYINSSLSSREIEQRMINARNGMYDLFYCAPERLQTASWKAELHQLNIEMVAVDEAHCISEWGHDFRPIYREIRSALNELDSSVRWLALTATATPRVRKDILENLQFSEPVVVSKSFQRPNLKWWVLEGADKRKNLLRAVKKAVQKGSGIVYGGTRKNCERLAGAIHQKLDIQTAAYHAGMCGHEREAIQEQWFRGEIPVVVATTAFGMGIDKADCRFVIHYQMTHSLEAYYQQAGRAGRDGKESYPVLLYKRADAHQAVKRVKDSWPTAEQLQQVYDAVCDTLQLPVGSQLDELSGFSLDDIEKRTHFSKRIIRASLKLLKRFGFLELVDHIPPKIGVLFTVSQDHLRRYIEKEENKKKAMFMDVLYRQFGEQAFRERKYLETGYIRPKLQVGKNSLLQGLQVLQDHDHILQYEERGEHPMVRPTEARMRSLPLNHEELESYRDSLLQKLEFMAGYIETSECREMYIRSYFGEKNVKPCGHCDNCLKAVNRGDGLPTSQDVEMLRDVLSDGNKDINQLKRELQWKSRKIENSLSYLIRENRVEEENEKYRWKG